MQSRVERKFLKINFVTIVLLFFVILAGGIVRSTGSGMGCPDWPKCFGHYVPPTTIDELTFSEGKFFKKGYIVIWNEALYKAKKDLTAGPTFNHADWEKYTKHDYAKFNVAHTWTEYLNRLAGVILGFAAIATLLFSIPYLKTHRKKVFWLSLFSFLLIGFQGWVGAKVVDSNLKAYMVTIHMLIALIILALYVYLYEYAKDRKIDVSFIAAMKMGSTKVMLIILLVLTALQILLGTQVRELIDEISAALNFQGRDQWVSKVGSAFIIHRELAFAVLAISGWIWFAFRKLKSDNTLKKLVYCNAALVVVQLITGIALAYLSLPPAAQTLHVLVGCLMFGIQFWAVLCFSKIDYMQEAIA
ncbi:COX15/CtaA family protein [Solitalea koreensis]|uniref:Cytochrome c oxidase assembly protein subunit 15 n=1 Tax=Solitalea koreensis TaxID=543615 RepID=A0A521AW31_9SPHI|nr:COX15/CtaA family protein [Solitalea koreensis]SMO38931.1 cytochrome c oxidase assembly protein subunit 15 [Solitalea koreensis]